jgi:hypothetical protein
MPYKWRIVLLVRANDPDKLEATMFCTICNNEVEVLAHTNNVEICLICVAHIQRKAMNFGKPFEFYLAKELAKVGA